jgi:hypothetical protein
MSAAPKPTAPHVQAALRRAAPAPARPAVPAARPSVARGVPAPHVQAALGRTAPAPPPVQARPSPAVPATPAAHVRAVVQRKEEASSSSAPVEKAEKRSPAHLPPTQSGEFTVYEDRKTPGVSPPPPRWPVYSLHCPDGGPCMLEDVKTGRLREAGTVYGGFVRMSRTGPVYLSPRPALGFPGDSHPTIAAGTPDGQRGKRALVAAGEVGIIDGQVVGHSDKTGHYQTRKNLYQSGLPADKFHPFTEDPREWYRKPR